MPSGRDRHGVLDALTRLTFPSTPARKGRTINLDRDANAKRSGFQPIPSTVALSIGLFPRSEECRAKGKHMRTLVQPPPCSRCELCGGELLLKRIERASLVLDLENELFVCANCGHEKLYAGHHDPYMPHTKVV